jgi:hypothetical protein
MLVAPGILLPTKLSNAFRRFIDGKKYGDDSVISHSRGSLSDIVIPGFLYGAVDYLHDRDFEQAALRFLQTNFSAFCLENH